MPCPYFEPREPVPEPTRLNARLPLIDEFDGFCHAIPTAPHSVPPDARFRLCNHGNARGQCPNFPAHDNRSSYRYEVLRRSVAHLDLLFVEESLYTPVSWHRLAFDISAQSLAPEPSDLCRRSQLLAFCRSFLYRYPEHVKPTEQFRNP
jgi:hypothetical protein